MSIEGDALCCLLGIVCLLSDGLNAALYTHSLFTLRRGKITPSTNSWSFWCHVLSFFGDTLLHTQSAHPVRRRDESVCLNLLFVMQVISEEGVSFKVSLFSHHLFLSSLSAVLLLVYEFLLFLSVMWFRGDSVYDYLYFCVFLPCFDGEVKLWFWCPRCRM